MKSLKFDETEEKDHTVIERAWTVTLWFSKILENYKWIFQHGLVSIKNYKSLLIQCNTV